ncbi:hypothetical protein [Cryobacterium sp. N19]|uniref:hypothetical protein n=1 Tax=Cryobacterium sp. N19 TaxID=2048288 RepID=UPI000CE51999|nr:hypothetical protein [Cryobacterium sp. N19]
MSQLDQDWLKRVGTFMNDECGYIAIQSTRPGLLGIALTDSPVAQLAWMFDKFRAWTWPVEKLPDEILGREWILANASLYWFTGSGGSSAYVGYAQNSWGAAPANSGVPTAAIQFAHDVGIAQNRFKPTQSCAGPTSKTAATASPPSKSQNSSSTTSDISCAY